MWFFLFDALCQHVPVFLFRQRFHRRAFASKQNEIKYREKRRTGGGYDSENTQKNGATRKLFMV